MPKGLRKSSIFLIPLTIVATAVACDSDFNFKNPFAKNTADSDTVEVIDPVEVEEKTVIDTTAVVAMDSEATNTNEVQQNTGPQRWRLVVSSVKEKSRAERLASEIGNPQVEILYVDYLNTYRVVCGSFNELRQAQERYAEVQQDFPEAWLVYY